MTWVRSPRLYPGSSVVASALESAKFATGCTDLYPVWRIPARYGRDLGSAESESNFVLRSSRHCIGVIAFAGRAQPLRPVQLVAPN
jgi:hypothetical protein